MFWRTASTPLFLVRKRLASISPVNVWWFGDCLTEWHQKSKSFRVKNEIGAVRGKEGWGEVKLWRREKKAAPTSSSLPVRNSPICPRARIYISNYLHSWIYRHASLVLFFCSNNLYIYTPCLKFPLKKGLKFHLIFQLYLNSIILSK